MVDLKALAAESGFHTTLDEAAEQDTDKAQRAWLVRVPCKHGHIGVWGKNTLSAYTSGLRIRRRLVSIPGVQIVQRGDSEVQVTFAPELLDAIAGLLQARKKRRPLLTEGQRAEKRRILTANLDLRRSKSTLERVATG